jgi:hypothetical protein
MHFCFCASYELCQIRAKAAKSLQPMFTQRIKMTIQYRLHRKIVSSKRSSFCDWAYRRIY